MSLGHLVLLLVAGQPIESATLAGEAQAACSAPIGERPAIAGIEIEAHAATDDDLPFLKITDQRSGGFMKAYYDRASEAAAWARAACLGAQINLVTASAGPLPDNGWNDVVFTSDATYEPPRDGAETRWKVRLRPDGTFNEAAHSMVVETIPHEQVHEYQTRAGALAPRWFAEGHAEWIGRTVTGMIAPGMEPPVVRDLRLAGGQLPEKLALSAWGGVRPKREAILRQVSPADRHRMEADPSFMPRGSFTFGPGDLDSDETNTAARYQGSWAIFHGLEQQHGAAAVRGWAAELTSRKGNLADVAIRESAQLTLNEDLASRLE